MEERAIEFKPKRGWCVFEKAPQRAAGKRLVGIVPIDPATELYSPAVNLAKQIAAIPELIRVAQVAAAAGNTEASMVLERLQLTRHGQN